MAPPRTSQPRVKGRSGAMIAVAAAAAFLATFNETVLNVAFTPIMQDFGIDVGAVQWLTTGYLLVAAVLVPVSIVLYHRFPPGLWWSRCSGSWWSARRSEPWPRASRCCSSAVCCRPWAPAC